MQLIGSLLLFLSGVGTICLIIAAIRLSRIGHAPPLETRHEAVTILKPLYGAEPQLLANLSTFLRQDHGGEIQLICGVHSRTDSAVAVVERLQARHPQADIMLTIETNQRGTNAKVSNLIAMVAHARHPVLILSDSDMAVGPDYITTITAALAAPGVEAITCLYRGRGDAGGWSRLAAMGISQHFLPSVLLGTTLGLATPCMGSTIALRQTTLEAIGGFDAFADLLADDYAIGKAVRQRGETVALPDLLLTHACTEASLAALVRQELRWNRTIAQLDPMGFIGSIILHPLPLALLGAALSGFSLIATTILVAALLARTAIALLVDRTTGTRTAPLLWIAPRDHLSFVLFFWTFFGRAVDWRGTAFTVDPTGRLSTHQDNVQ
jgi:ceramide glucosyltransferase